jgi:hypothetical protein
MSSVNDSPNHLMMLDAISTGMKSVSKVVKVTILDKALMEMVVNGLISQRLVVIAEWKGFFGSKKERNND